MKFTVGTEDLRQALRAVGPHADPDKDFPQLHRIRLEVGPENVTVSATNRYTVGHALVSVWDNADGELGVVDLSPTDAKEILALFHGKAGKEDVPSDCLEIEATDKHLEITDVSGLFAGKALTLPRYPEEDNFPDVAKLIASKLTEHREEAGRLVTSGQLFGLFMKAASAYGEPLVIDPSGENAAMLITCGESFIGLLVPQRPDDERAAQIEAWHTAWVRRIGERVPV